MEILGPEQKFPNGTFYHLIAKQTANILRVFMFGKRVKWNNFGLSPYKLEPPRVIRA